MRIRLLHFGLGLVSLSSILMSGCSIETAEDTSSAEQETPTVSITVISVEDLSQRTDYLGRSLGYNSLLFEVLLEPSGVDAIIPWEKYVVALVSKDGYVFSTQEVSWLASDFKTPPATERNLDEIRKIEQQRQRTVRLTAPLTDKDIRPLFYELLETEAYKYGRITEVMQKHVEITFMTIEEWTEWMKQE